MRRSVKTSFVAGLGIALVMGALGSAAAGAQALPAVPGGGATLPGCVVVADLSPCVAAAKMSLPVGSVPGLGGTRNVQIDKDVDENRVPATVEYE